MLYDCSTKKFIDMEKDNRGTDWHIVKIDKECTKCMGGWDITLGLTDKLTDEHIFDIVITAIRKIIPTFDIKDLDEHKIKYI